jgi:hypothetical protein
MSLSTYTYTQPVSYATGLSATTVYSSFAGKLFTPVYPGADLLTITAQVRVYKPGLDMIVVAPATRGGWSAAPGYNAVLIGLLLPAVQKLRQAAPVDPTIASPLKQCVKTGGRAGVLTYDSPYLSFNWVTWLP